MKKIDDLTKKVENLIDKNMKNILNLTAIAFSRYIKELNDAVDAAEITSDGDSLNINNFNYPKTTAITTLFTSSIPLYFEDVYKKAYYHMNYISGALFGNATKTTLSTKAIHKALTYNSIGLSLEEMLQDYIEDLDIKTQKKIMQQFKMGYSKAAIKKTAKNSIGITYNKFKQMVQTETTHTSSTARLDALKQDKYLKKVQVLATLDNKTSKICRKMDGKIFDINTVTQKDLPPYHPRCRSCFQPYVDDVNERYDNENKVVIDWMTYQDWAK